MGLETPAVPSDFLCGISQMHLASPYMNTSASAVTGGWEEREGCGSIRQAAARILCSVPEALGRG